MLDDYLKANLANWDERVGVHVESDLYDVEGFKSGRSSLTRVEQDELGADLPMRDPLGIGVGGRGFGPGAGNDVVRLARTVRGFGTREVREIEEGLADLLLGLF